MAADAAVDKAVNHWLAWLLRSTAQRPQTQAELAARLRAKELDDALVDAVLHRARALRAVDDAAFAALWVRDRGEVRGYGVSRLRRELRRRLVPEPLIDDALAQMDGRDELAVATELARARNRGIPPTLQPEAVARRLMAYLVRRGYGQGLALRVAREVSGLDRAWD